MSRAGIRVNKNILRICVAIFFLFLFGLWAWTRFLLVEAWEVVGGQLAAISLMQKYYAEGQTQQACMIAREIEAGVLQYATYRKIYHGLTDVLANHYWHRIGEYALPPSEEEKFSVYMSNAVSKSWSYWSQLEDNFVYYDSPWSCSKWNPNWMNQSGDGELRWNYCDSHR